jgi:hypothetical protein
MHEGTVKSKTLLTLLLLTGIMLVVVSGCVTQPIPVFITGKLKLADGTYVAIVNDTAYLVTSEWVYNNLIINQTNYVNFDATSIGIPSGTRISGVQTR